MTLLTLFCCLFFVDGYIPFEKTGNNFFHIFLNGTQVGTVGEEECVENLLIAARKNVASQSQNLLFMEVEMSIEGEEVLWGYVDDEKEIIANMEKVLENSVQKTMRRAYTLKVNEYMVNLASRDDVLALLQAALDKYSGEGKFAVELMHDEHREFDVLTNSLCAYAIINTKL